VDRRRLDIRSPDHDQKASQAQGLPALFPVRSVVEATLAVHPPALLPGWRVAGKPFSLTLTRDKDP